MKKYLVLIIVAMFSLTFTISCNKDEKEEEEIDMCTDGIQNGDETDIDCGGECQSCEELFLCEGTNSNMLIPYDKIEEWVMPRASGFGTGTYKYTLVGTEEIDSNTYYKINVYQGINGWDYFEYYRISANGEVFTRNEYDEVDYLYVSDIKEVGYEWSRPTGGDSFKLTSKTASIETSKCNYTGLIEIEHYHNGELYDKFYYKKGLGRVFTESFGMFAGTRYLKSISLQ